MQFQIGDKVSVDGIEYKITQELMGIYWGKKKYAREEIELSTEKITPIESGSENKLKFSNKERGKILKDLVELTTLRENFQREMIILSKLIKKFPHKDFWLEGFKPALKVDSLSYWFNRSEVEELYKKWSINLETNVEKVKLEKTKVGEDIVLDLNQKKPKNLLELLK